VVTPAARREVVGVLRESFSMSERRACRAIGMSRSTFRYEAECEDPTELRTRLRELAQARPRFGYRRLDVLLRREGRRLNHKRVYRLYRLQGLSVRRRKRKRVARGRGPILLPPTKINQRWSMDFMGDTLAAGRTFRLLNIVDDFSRECVVIDSATSIPGTRVVRVLDEFAEARSSRNDRDRQRAGVHEPSARRVGLSPPRASSLHHSRPARRKRLHRKL
jgi:putative transposase